MNPLDQLLARPKGPDLSASLLWGTVQKLSPLTVLPDGSGDAIENVANAAGELSRGDRVYLGLSRRRMTVLGRSSRATENLLPGGSFEDYADGYTAFPSSGNIGDVAKVGANPDVWTISDNTTGTVSVDGSVFSKGTRSLKTVTPSGQSTAVRSPVVAVTPGVTYLVRWRSRKSTSQVARTYHRLAAGSTKDLTEWPAYNPSTYLAVESSTIENQDVQQTTFTQYSLVATIPSGINYIALRLLSYQPTGTSTVHFDEVEVYPLTGPEAWYGDTGWISPALVNSWLDYGSPYGPHGFRRVGKTVEMAGLLKNGTNSTMFTLPPGFRSKIYRIAPVMLSTNAATRLNLMDSGTVQVPSYSATWTSIVVPPWSID